MKRYIVFFLLLLLTVTTIAHDNFDIVEAESVTVISCSDQLLTENDAISVSPCQGGPLPPAEEG